MGIFGHYETVPVRGTHRKAKIYISSLLKHILISLAIAFVPFAIVLSSRPTPEEFWEEFRSPWLIGFTLLMFFLALVVFWGNRMFAKDTRRMQAGDLVARTGVMWAIGQENLYGRSPGSCRLVIETQTADGQPLRNEIYEISEKLYRRHLEKRAVVRGKYSHAGYAWLVELAVLPPADGPEFTEPSPSPSPSPGKAEKTGKSQGPLSRRFGFEDMPVSHSVVAEIFYLEKQPYGCVINDSSLFSKQ